MVEGARSPASRARESRPSAAGYVRTEVAADMKNRAASRLGVDNQRGTYLSTIVVIQQNYSVMENVQPISANTLIHITRIQECSIDIPAAEIIYS